MRTKDPTDPVIQRLREIARISPFLAEAARLHERILPLLRNADLHAAPLMLTSLQIQEKLQQGIPLLFDRDLAVDAAAASDLMIKLAEAESGEKSRAFPLRLLEKKPAPRDQAAALKIRTALAAGRLNTGHLLSLTAAGDHDAVSAAATEQGLDPDTVRRLVQNTLQPALRAWCRQLSPLSAGISWDKSICLVCGAPATLAELQNNEQEKHLRCGACGADWQVKRLRCVQCGNDDHRTQHLLYTEGMRDTLRIEACDVCKGYIKVVASFSPASPEMIPIEDLATIQLDILAREHGYFPLSSTYRGS